MPFFAESIYLKLKGDQGPESVHLSDFPEAAEVDEEILENMKEVRDTVSLALEKRMAAGVKVRQPLQKLKIKNLRLKDKEEYLELVKDELNVKEVVFDGNLVEAVELDIEITAELQKEGNVRDLIRAIQDLRKQKDLLPREAVILHIETDKEGERFIQEFEKEIKQPTNIGEIIFENNDGEELNIQGLKFKLQIK